MFVAKFGVYSSIDTSNKGSNSYLWSSPKRSSPQASASKKSIIKPMFNITAFNNTNNQVSVHSVYKSVSNA